MKNTKLNLNYFTTLKKIRMKYVWMKNRKYFIQDISNELREFDGKIYLKKLSINKEEQDYEINTILQEIISTKLTEDERENLLDINLSKDEKLIDFHFMKIYKLINEENSDYGKKNLTNWMFNNPS